MADEFITLDQAADLVQVSRATLWRRIKQDQIQTYQSQQDRRVRLVKRADIDPLLGPKPVVVHTPVLEGDTKKATAGVDPAVT